MKPSKIEQAAIDLHDYLWEYTGYTADWPIEIAGDDSAVTELIRRLNTLQDAIKESGLDHRQYQYVSRS
jgi:hypothetical protein